MSDKTYPKGSEWRKWDLHIHTPKSIIQEYGGDDKSVWDNFIKAIADLPKEIKVIGITDYLFIDGYEYLITRKEEIPKIDLIIPNIEFRLNTFSGTENNTKRHNFHVLFDPIVGVDDIKEQLLNCLSSAYLIEDNTEWKQTPTRRSLEELGRQIKVSAPQVNSIQSKSNLKVGFDNITYKKEDILDNLKKSCFKGKYVTAIGYSEWDQSRWDQSAAEKRDLIMNAGFSLTCSNNLFDISENKKDLKMNKLNDLILHSSDAHKLESIGKTYLWIKADPTFSGLKEVLNEPETRVFIGDNFPNYKHNHQIISEISIPQSNGWFKDGFKLKLNRDLITIIGGRGSGKSALAEMIAYGAGSKDNSKEAFLKKAAKHKNSITGTKICLGWSDGETTEFQVGGLKEDHGLVRYLPQGAVETLCSPDNSEDLRNQIESVIFQALDETEKMGTSDFVELRERILINFRYEKEEIETKIGNIIRKLKVVLDNIKDIPNKEKRLEVKKIELTKLVASLPKLLPEDKAGQEELTKLLELKNIFSEKIIEFRKTIEKINEIDTGVRLFSLEIKDFEEKISLLLSESGITDLEVFKIGIKKEEIDKILAVKKKVIENIIKTLKEGNKDGVMDILKIEEDKLLFHNLLLLNRGIEQKSKETKAYETVKLKYQKQKKLIGDIKNDVDLLEKEISTTKQDIFPQENVLKSQLLTNYHHYFDILKREKEEIQKLYRPLQAILSEGTETDKKLQFDAKISYNLDQHYRQGLSILDRTKKGNFREEVSLKESLLKMWEEFSRKDFSEQIIAEQLKNIVEQFTRFDGEDILIEDQIRQEFNMTDFFDWIFNPSYFTIMSSLKFDETDLNLLSPGQKGIVLLMLYLEVDKEDYRPLIIDQPEENLDNLSIYNDLIAFFRERKLYRQIIMITHNPNLVVNTDSEQVIVANYNGKRTPILEYVSGSLEDQAKKTPEIEIDELEDGIIEQVCTILEGGEPAFRKRKKKYQISSKNFQD
jgi:hypothetical protein